MFSDHVSMRDYTGFGSIAMEDLNGLQKALEAGYAISGQTGGAALRVQSLEASLKVLTYRSEHVKLWKKMPKTPAFSTTEEYNQVTAYGETRAGVFTREGELPQSSDSTYVRRTALVKFLGTTREVTHPMALVNPAHGDVIALQAHDAILHLLRAVELKLFQGDASLAYSGEAEEWDGLDSLIDASAFIDLAEDPLQEADVTDAANFILENFGYPTDLYLGVKPLADFTKTLYPRMRVQLPAPVDGRVGMSITSMLTPAGEVLMNSSVFLQKGESPPSAGSSPNAPEVPQTLSSGGYLGNGTADWQKQLGTPTAATSFSYAVTASNRFGESAPLIADIDVTAAACANQTALKLTVVNAAAVGANPPEFFKFYRTKPGVTSTDPADFSLIQKIAVTDQANGATMTDITADRNLIIPFTYIAYMLQLDPTVMTFRQLAPMMKMDLSVIAPAYRFMVLLYGVPVVFAPLKACRIINIGEVAGAVA